LSSAQREEESVGGTVAAVAVKRPVSELEAENARLRRELASAKLDLEIVKKRRRISQRSRGEVRLDRTASRRLLG
jgi:hypothetical protein